MQADLTQALERMVQKFELRGPLNDSDRTALLSLPFQLRTVEAGKYLVREGTEPTESQLLVSGFAARNKETADGDRQILSIHIPGDFFDLEGSLLRVSDYNVQALTRSQVAVVPSTAVHALIDGFPKVGKALWVDTLVEASIHREWITNVGQRQAPQRIGHLLCELGRRLEVAGLGTQTGYRLPMTQEQFADATGLTPVHVNRTLKLLEGEGLIVRFKRFIEIPNWENLRDMSGFNELYLHLDQVPADEWQVV